MPHRGKLTDDVQHAICEALRNGNRFEVACRLAGVAPRTVEDWLARGRGDHPTRRTAPRYTAFLDAYEAAIADSEAALVALWREAAKTDWRAARDMLARRFPDAWGATVKMVGADGGPLRVEVVEVDAWRDVQAEV